VANSQEVIEASRIKGENIHSPMRDCFLAVATARREKASLIMGDPEFKKNQGIIEIDWL